MHSNSSLYAFKFFVVPIHLKKVWTRLDSVICGELVLSQAYTLPFERGRAFNSTPCG